MARIGARLTPSSKARSAEMIPAEELVVPAVVIDIRQIAAQDVDYRLTAEDITAWEADNGEIPGVALCSC